MSNLRDIKDTEYTEVTSAEGTVIVDVWAPWCQPCKMLTPVLEKFAEANPAVTIVKLNADETELLGQLGVRGVPTLLKYVDGTLVDTTSGPKTATQLTEFVG